jgi:hypothetical protein
MNAVKRSLDFVKENLKQMERNNARLRGQARFRDYDFEEMPDPTDAPDEIVSPGLVSIFYLAGYDHLNQSAIVSIVLEALFAHRSTLSGVIPPFQAVIEEAHNFIPSRQEGTDETPSLPTIRKVITEGRKFGTGLVLISQRPSRLDETTLAQCNSFLVLRLVNPRDKSFVRSVMENLSEADANGASDVRPRPGPRFGTGGAVSASRQGRVRRRSRERSNRRRGLHRRGGSVAAGRGPCGKRGCNAAICRTGCGRKPRPCWKACRQGPTTADDAAARTPARILTFLRAAGSRRHDGRPGSRGLRKPPVSRWGACSRLAAHSP